MVNETHQDKPMLRHIIDVRRTVNESCHDESQNKYYN